MESSEGTKRVLLTGASGLVGQPCQQRLLDAGFEVWAASSSHAVNDQGRLHWRQADLLDPAARRGLLAESRPSHLLHLAWHSGREIYRSAENYRWLAASLELLRDFVAGGGQRVVFVGSSAEYAWGEEPCSELHTPLVPSTTYGLAKRALSELFTDFIAHHGPPLGGAWARLFFLYGAYEKPPRLLASVIHALLRGEPARCSHGRQLRDYLSTIDAADALVKVLDSELDGPINIASGEAVELRRLILGAARWIGREDLVELGALAVPADDPPRVVADVSRLRDELGWRPRLSLDEGLRQTVDWWRVELALGEEGT